MLSALGVLSLLLSWIEEVKLLWRRWWSRKAATAVTRAAERRERETATATSFLEMGLDG